MLLVPRLRLGTHRLGGSASLLQFGWFEKSQAEPAVHWVTRQSLGTSIAPRSQAPPGHALPWRLRLSSAVWLV